jgi:hypothetical protein
MHNGPEVIRPWKRSREPVVRDDADTGILIAGKYWEVWW